jgi:type II secretory pathway component PulF
MICNAYVLLAESAAMPSALAVLPTGIVLLVLWRLLDYLEDKRERRSWGRVPLLAARVVLALGVLLVAVCGLGMVLGPVALIVVGFVVREVRQARRRMLLEMLAVAAERSLPLAGAVQAFAGERFGFPAGKARRLSALLTEGRSLSDALDGVCGLFSPEARMQIRLGEDLAALAPALREAMGPPSWEELIWRQLAGKVLYLSAVVLFLASVVTFILLKIIPAYYKICADFGAKLPHLTKSLLVAQTPPFSLAACLVLAIAAYTLLRALGLVRWNLPGMNRLLRGRYAGTILDALALSTRCERPLPQTIELLAQRYPRRWVRRRLMRVAGDIRSGRAWSESLHAYGLITRAEAAVLQAAQRVGNLSWALQEMAAGSRRRLGYRVQAWMQVAFPLAIGLIGFAVLLIVVGLYSPLLQLLRTIAG